MWTVGMLLALPAFAWALVCAWNASDGFQSVLDYLIYFWGGIVVGALCAVSATVIVLRRVLGGEHMSWRTNLAPWALQPLAIVSCFVLVHTNVMFRLRWAASASAFGKAAQQVIAGGRPDASPRWIGLLKVRETNRVANSVRFVLAECHLIDECGLAYSRDGRPAVDGEDTYEHFRGPWWYWWRSW